MNSYGDSRKITLPHSGITVRVSVYWWQEDPWDSRQWKAPDVAAELTSARYRANVDPALKTVLEYRAELPIVDRMNEALSSGSLLEALRGYREYMADPRHAYADNEAELNNLGYRLLGEGRNDQAIAILELNAAEHPESANVYDSLGEAYEKTGQPRRRRATIAGRCSSTHPTPTPRACWRSFRADVKRVVGPPGHCGGATGPRPEPA